MIKLFLNQDFKAGGLIPDLENIKKFLTSQGDEIDQQTYSDLTELSKKNISNSIIRCDLEFGAAQVTQLAMAPENVRFSRTFDSLSFENGTWLPRLRYFDVLRRKIVTQFGNIEIKEAAGVICDSAMRDGLVSVLVSLGFKTVLLFMPDGSDDVSVELSRYFIGIKFVTIPFAHLTQNQELTSLIVNSVDLESNSALMNDLAYFNFVSSDAIIVDLMSKTPIHPLLFEAEKAGLRTMKRRDVAAFYDYESLRTIYGDVEKSKNEFLQNYLEIETID